MSAEAELRAALLASPALLAVVPAARISLDMVESNVPRPYIVINKESAAIERGLDNTAFARQTTFRLLCVGTDRVNAIAVANLTQAALEDAGAPPDARAAAFDADLGAEVEIVSLDWWD